MKITRTQASYKPQRYMTTSKTINLHINATPPSQVSFTGLTVPLLKQSRAAEQNMFRPFRGPNNINKMSAGLQHKIKEVNIITEDGINLACWDIPPKEGNPYILYCHGLRKNLTMSKDLLEYFSKKGYGLFGVEYRGYAGNKGISSQENHLKDTKAALEYLTQNKNIQQNKIIALGESLGGAIAVDLASKTNNLMGLVVISSLTKAQELAKYNLTHNPAKNVVVKIKLNSSAKKLFKVLPSSAIPIKNKYNSVNSIEKIKYPIFIIHSKPDTEIPCEMSVKLAKAAKKNNKDVELKLLETGTHLSIKEKLEDINTFIQKLVAIQNN